MLLVKIQVKWIRYTNTVIITLLDCIFDSVLFIGLMILLVFIVIAVLVQGVVA